MKKLLLFFSLITIVIVSQAQPSPKDSLHVTDSISKATAKTKAYRDSLEKDYLSKVTYPLVKSSKYSGVIPVPNVDEKPDINQRYKLLMEVTTGIKDSTAAKEINGSLGEVARLINIHIAAGIPKKNLDIVVVAHGGILRSFYNDEAYNKKYKINNPNIALFNELLAAGVKFIACGQAMSFLNITKEQMLPWMKVALSAQTVLTNYQLKGYVHKYISDEN